MQTFIFISSFLFLAEYIFTPTRLEQILEKEQNKINLYILVTGNIITKKKTRILVTTVYKYNIHYLLL